jgi:2-phospho-L-lactate guanylyltransferase
MWPVEDLAILVPLKSFDVAKSRLREGGVAKVDELARALAFGVFQASRPRPLFVASESPNVTSFALEYGAEVIESSVTGLNEAVTNAYQQLGGRFQRIVVAHGDIHNPQGLGDFEPRDGVTIITDARRTGTNVLALPTGLDFTFHFGAASAAAHEREAQRLGIQVHMDFNSPWRFDVDEPGDLER